MLTLRRSGPLDETSRHSAAGRPVLLATLDVPFDEDATAFAVDSALENGQPLVIVNAAEVLLTPWMFLGYGYVERDDLQNELRKPADLARSLAVRVERLRVCSPHPIEALLQLVVERNPGVLVFGPDRSRLKTRTYRRAVKKINECATCLIWVA
jgi:hypothetical protein